MAPANVLNRLLAPILLLIVILFYASTLQNGFVFDDEHFILKNSFLTSFSNLPEILTNDMVAGSGGKSNLFRPLQVLTHLIDVTLFGYRPWGHHLTNLILFLILTLSLFSILKNLFHPLAAFMTTTLFVVHPIQAEAVAYISGRGDILGMIFLFQGTLWFKRNLYIALIMSVLAIMSKESLVLFPAFLTIYLILQNKTIKLNKRLLIKTIPFWIISSLYVILRLTIFNFDNTLNFYKTSNIFTENIQYRILTYITTLPKSFFLWIYPFDLHHERSWPIFTNPLLLLPAVSIIFLLLLIFIIFYFRKKFLPISCGILWFLIATTPTSNIIFIINAIIYDHWFIIPGIGLTFIIGAILNKLVRTPTLKKYILYSFTLLVLFQLPVTYKYNSVWHGPKSLYSHILKFEKSAKALNNLGMAYASEGNLTEAIYYYEESLKISDTYFQTRFNLGNLHFNLKNYSEAKKHLLRSIELEPNFNSSHLLLKKIDILIGNHEKAKKVLVK